ncbi:carboxymuconolactone decarboxylase family protein [Caldimonas thermodepolymerans]|jgi:alkylhydroperoxidase AhpD family core domain|uniref:Alkylhydroperoxidase n=1 Tax=Caldimonas thermodepolymerans TaxID=215580 RepID=A0A2S5T7D9_9BURK|nr:carboxymuconolactone decarboxylase family protein [Caldimonas thermodepolymerans]PPE70777.1 alkylhydroperoxidase [Caldimonas thermodepolymerans]QPC32994.1 carboxymuconolactone decarboxylase family protein [Caldimonas thermodepolymerans]RDI03778.1 AhpD family alkylhydroperoxidase [Caldimonas thermodepolymerans]UZG45862.1 carboxymuconolactone decarboxylase family protein [Caldimonas thermodepolymerans]
MQQRIDALRVVPELMQAMVALEERVAAAGLEPALRHLVKTRASQINGCAFCVHMHTREARRDGESEERLYLLSAWRESPLYTERERAALAWTEAVTRVAETGAPDADYEAMRQHFDEKEAAALTFLIATINAWNRLGIALRKVHPVGKEAA